MTKRDELSLLIERVFDAPRELVFKAWIDKETMMKWSCPLGFSIDFPYTKADVHIGGRWRTLMIAPDKTEHRVSGVYTEIVEPERLSFTHAWEDERGQRKYESLVTVIFQEVGESKTRMIFQQTGFESAQSRDGHESGWSECFNKLGELLGRAAS